jgi:hypothetical protein
MKISTQVLISLWKSSEECQLTPDSSTLFSSLHNFRAIKTVQTLHRSIFAIRWRKKSSEWDAMSSLNAGADCSQASE